MWEPETLGQKLKAILSTQAELLFCMFVVGLALYLSSGISVGFMLISFILMHTSMYPQQYRWKCARIFLYIYLFLIISITVFKYTKIETMRTETRVWKNYQYEIKFYELLGFKINAKDRHAPPETRAKLDADPKFFYKYSADISQSFYMEIGLFVFSLGLLFFAMNQQKKINYLSDENN